MFLFTTRGVCTEGITVYKNLILGVSNGQQHKLTVQRGTKTQEFQIIFNLRLHASVIMIEANQKGFS